LSHGQAKIASKVMAEGSVKLKQIHGLAVA
jgi:hypothetical protein